MFKGVLSFLLLLSVSFSAYAEVSVDKALWEKSPFDQAVQLQVLKKVCEHMGVDFDETKEIPPVLISESITEDQTLVVAAADSQGIPFWALEKGMNLYLLDLNKIVLGRKMKVHNLAHEFAHYVQYTYFNYSKDEFSGDDLEMDAIYAQNLFRD